MLVTDLELRRVGHLHTIEIIQDKSWYHRGVKWDSTSQTRGRP